MMRFLLIILFIISGFHAIAQPVDSLFAERKGATWYIKYTVKPGETAHMLATRFYISDGVLEYANDPDELKKLSPGTIISIPVTKDNFFLHKTPLDGLHVLYCHVAAK